MNPLQPSQAAFPKKFFTLRMKSSWPLHSGAAACRPWIELTAGIARLCKLQSCANCTPLRANPRTPWTGRLEYSSLRIPGVVQCYARCWIEEIGLRRIPKRSEEYLTRPPLSTHVSSMMSSLMMMARTHNSGLQCWVWLMRGRVAGKPHKVFFPISAARDPRKVALITVVTIIFRELNFVLAHN